VNLDELEVRIEETRRRIASAATRVGRDPSTVSLLPVTKGHPATVVERVSRLGFDRIGENRVGEAEAKRAELGTLGVAWHMIGHLQRNKAARAVALFDVVESLDSLRLARKLDAEARSAGRDPLPVLLQVNASGEDAKGGFPVDGAIEPIREICALEGLRVRGLMTMAPLTDDEGVLRSTFRRARECFERCGSAVRGFEPAVLSMGMSNDFEIAVEEGSTELRLGTVLLGERPER
jgi:pyridoxal phosphate enzyme (YggS family)